MLIVSPGACALSHTRSTPEMPHSWRRRSMVVGAMNMNMPSPTFLHSSSGLDSSSAGQEG
jgi:hypothetical protein